MGAQGVVKKRVVFDTNTVVSALVFEHGRLEWLRKHWQKGDCAPLISTDTTLELMRVLRYPKFRLSPMDCEELLADYLPYCEAVDALQACTQKCRDPKDQIFLDLAKSGGADFLVTGDRDLLEFSGLAEFEIETPELYRRRISGE